MENSSSTVLDDLRLDHVRFHVGSIEAARERFFGGYGLVERAVTEPFPGEYGSRSLELCSNRIRFRLSEPIVGDHPAAAYLDRHGDGVSDIALRVGDASTAFREAVRRGARPVSAPVHTGRHVTASIMAFGDVTHTFVERPAEHTPREAESPAEERGLLEVDHFAVCVEHGAIDATVEFYRDVLGFELVFAETIQVGAQAMITKVVQSRSGAVTLTLIEPDPSGEAGHLDDFLKLHGGAGVQHIALATDDITEAVSSLRAGGVEFMETPDSYYSRLLERVVPVRYSVEQLRRERILVDEDHDGQLYQVFTRSGHPRNTLFFELIEREGARSFGSGNITALYEAAERERDTENR